jgi:hypothetical protein
VSTGFFEIFLQSRDVSRERSVLFCLVVFAFLLLAFGTTDDRRFQHSTQEHSNIYFEEFVEAAKELGIATVDDAGNVTSLDLFRCLTSDEEPSIMGQSNRGGSGSSVIAGFGDAVAKTIMDNKRRISYDQWLTLSGVWVLHHFILPGWGCTS